MIKHPPLGLMHSINKTLINIDVLKRDVELSTKINFIWFYSDVTGSTNSDLLTHKHAYSIAISEYQNSGRGQGQNTWVASHAENLLFSIALPISIDETLALMPIKIGLAIKQTLNQAGFNEVSLKWPNDIFYKEKKVGGVLIESITQNNTTLAIIGVGLNVNMPYKNTDSFISLKQQKYINRTTLLSQCLITIINALNKSQNETVQTFNQAHLFHLKPIQFNIGQHTISGICQGINAQGQLLIDTKHGLTTHSTGSIVMSSP